MPKVSKTHRRGTCWPRSAQGYFYARPLTATQFEDYMDENLAAASTISPGLVS